MIKPVLLAISFFAAFSHGATTVRPSSASPQPLCRVDEVILIDRTFFTSHLYDVVLKPYLLRKQQVVPLSIDLRTSIVEYADRPKLLLNFTNPLAKVRPNKAFENFTLSTEDLGANADLGKALEFVRKSVMTPSTGFDPTRTKFVTIAIGNNPRDQQKAESEALALKSSGVVIVVVAGGVNTYNRTNYFNIRTAETTYIEFPSTELGDLDKLANGFLMAMCPQAYRPPPAAATTTTTTTSATTTSNNDNDDNGDNMDEK